MTQSHMYFMSLTVETYNPFGIGDYDFIRPEHVNWLRETHQTYQTQFQHNFQHNLLFTHIPLQEYRS